MFRSRNYLLLFFILAILTLASCVGSTQKATAIDSTTPPQANNEKASNVKELRDYELQMFNDSGALTPVKLSEAVGKGKVVVIDFWATWCGPCRMSIPDLVALQNEYRDKGVQVFGLSNEDPEESKEKVANAARDLKINYKVGFVSREMFMSFTQVGSIPQCFIFGKDGRLVKHMVGFHPQLTPKTLRENINKALES